jgi:hypothetical protein
MMKSSFSRTAAHASIVPGRRAATSLPGSRTALHDPRWPAIAAALTALRDRGRFAVRIVDADCGAGCLLLQAAQYARSLGFTAIEGRGIDGSPALIGRAKAAASRQRDPAIGITFDLSDVLAALGEEHDLPADIVLWHGPRREAIDLALSRAADLVIGDDVAAGDAGPVA